MQFTTCAKLLEALGNVFQLCLQLVVEQGTLYHEEEVLVLLLQEPNGFKHRREQIAFILESFVFART